MLIYPDIETDLISFFQTYLPDIRVGTKKLPPSEPQPSEQIVVTVTYAGDKDHTLRYASVTVEVFADTDIEASTLALQVEAYLRTATGPNIKKVEMLVGPMRVAEQGPQELRSMAAELTIKGSDM